MTLYFMPEDRQLLEASQVLWINESSKMGQTQPPEIIRLGEATTELLKDLVLLRYKK